MQRRRSRNCLRARNCRSLRHRHIRVDFINPSGLGPHRTPIYRNPRIVANVCRWIHNISITCTRFHFPNSICYISKHYNVVFRLQVPFTSRTGDREVGGRRRMGDIVVVAALRRERNLGSPGPLLARQGRRALLLVHRGTQVRQVGEHKSHPRIRRFRSEVQAAANHKTARSPTARGRMVPSPDRTIDLARQGTTTGRGLQGSWVGLHHPGTKVAEQSCQDMPTRRDPRGSL